MENKIGQWVEMKPRFARWHLNHPNIYGDHELNEECITDYDIDTQLFLMCLWGIPIKGLVKMNGAYPGCYGIFFFHQGLSMFTFVDKKDLKWLK